MSLIGDFSMEQPEEDDDSEQENIANEFQEMSHVHIEHESLTQPIDNASSHFEISQVRKSSRNSINEST